MANFKDAPGVRDAVFKILAETFPTIEPGTWTVLAILGVLGFALVAVSFIARVCDGLTIGS